MIRTPRTVNEKDHLWWMAKKNQALDPSAYITIYTGTTKSRRLWGDLASDLGRTKYRESGDNLYHMKVSYGSSFLLSFHVLQFRTYTYTQGSLQPSKLVMFIIREVHGL